MPCDRLGETSWEPVSDSVFADAWRAEMREAEATRRRETLHLATGLLLPVWDELPDELAATALRTGKPLPLRGPEELMLKRSLVNSGQRLELAGSDPARLPWYKTQGCFTEIIRCQTRLFVPVDRAAGVLARLANRWDMDGQRRLALSTGRAPGRVSVLLAPFLQIVAAGATFACTPVAVWDGDGPIWCAEGPRVRIAGMATREMEGSCSPSQPCPAVGAVEARHRLVRLFGGPKGTLPTGYIKIRAAPMTCVSDGSPS